MAEPRARRSASALLACLCASSAAWSPALTEAQRAPAAYEFNDSHFHLTNYIQEGIDVERFLEIMGTRVGRSTLFGIPLQQTWSHENSGDFAPTYYLHTDAPLYYYSFTDAYIASLYRALSAEQQARFDPMITGFNPADMYGGRPHPPRAAARSRACSAASASSRSTRSSCRRRWRATRPASRIRRSIASSTFAAEVGPRRAAAQRHRRAVREDGRRTRVSHADEGAAAPASRCHDHLGARGLGRVVRPVGASAAVAAAERSPAHLAIVEQMLGDPTLAHVSFDISWDEVAEVCGRNTGIHGSDGGAAESVSRPLSVRHRHGGAGRARAIFRRVRDVCAGVEGADAGRAAPSAP